MSAHLLVDSCPQLLSLLPFVDRPSPSLCILILFSAQNMLLQKDSPSLDSSPFQLKSPRLYWEDRATLSPPVDSENSPVRSLSPEVTRRRSSLERLKSASRVKNSSMYAKENKNNYDPSSSPMIERPLSNRPWGGHLQNNVFARNDSIRKENSPFKSPEKPANRRSESTNDIPIISPSKIPAPQPAMTRDDLSASPRRDAPISPIRSSLAASSRFSPSAFDPENGSWSDEDDDDLRASTPRAQPRHAKSVTFQNSPPEINEYEEQTPEPSSLASGSREGSYDSYDDEEDDSFDHSDTAGNEDSFDASLEDTDKTPVVLPEDWRHMSPESARMDLVNDFDDVFEERGRGSPAPTATPVKGQRPPAFRTDSAASGASDGSDFRPLPPIPGFASPRRGRNESPRGLAMAAERASSLQRGLPTPPRAASVSKDEILRMREATMNLEDRMGLMALQESLAEVHKSRTASGGLAPPAELTEKSASHDEIAVHEEEIHDQDSDSEYLDDLPDYDAPSISRESILRNVKSNRFDDYDEYAEDQSTLSSPDRDYADLANLDPDVPIPSRENSTNFGADVMIKQEDDSLMDLDAIPAIMADDDHERQSSVIHYEVEHPEDDESHYDDESRYSSPMSDAFEQDNSVDDGTPRASEQPAVEEAFSTPLEESKQMEHSDDRSLPLLGLGTDDYDFGLKEYITPSPPASSHGEKKEEPEMASQLQESSNSIVNPPELFRPTSNSEAELPRTPVEEPELDFDDGDSFDSAIRDSITEEMLPVEDIPERRATIKTQGKLKARPSGNRADLQAMIQQRRQVSVEVPSIPDQFRVASLSASEASETDYMDTELDAEEGACDMDGEAASQADDSSEGTQADSFVEKEKRRQSRKQLKLDLDLPVDSLDNNTGLGLGLMEEFDRVMEAQKVVVPPNPYHSSAGMRIAMQHGGSTQGNSVASIPSVPHFSPHTRTDTNGRFRTQKGYLMRQNTKVVIASNRNVSNESQMSQRPMSPPQSPSMEAKPSTRGTRSAGNSPRKSSGGEKWLTAEPWNGKTRRKSTRKSAGRRSNVGVASPVLAQESALGTVDEMMTTDEVDENAERGRLFVKVVGVKDLDLPLPRSTYHLHDFT